MKINIHIVVSDEGIIVGAYDDINLVYDAFRVYLRKNNSEDMIDEFNNALLCEGDAALNHYGFNLVTRNLDSEFDWFN